MSGADTELRYRPAIELYRGTRMSVREICSRTGTRESAFRSFLRRRHRELMLARHGAGMTREPASTARPRGRRGPTAASRAKYGKAIEACDDRAYASCSVSQIARKFGLSPSALNNQLRNHYPEVLERRARACPGMSETRHRGVRPWCAEQYSLAVEHLRVTDDTVRQTAFLYDLSYSGLREHLLYAHKDLVTERAARRKRAMADRTIGGLAGNGGRRGPRPESVEKYREATRLYRATSMTQREICSETGVTLMGLRHHLRNWNRDLVKERLDSVGGTSSGKRYLKSTAAKYAAAISRLESSGLATSVVAREFGLSPDAFRAYLREHEPDLASDRGMKRLGNGRLVLARGAAKYEEAVRLYESTTETLKSISRRMGLTYNSVGGYVRRNHPEAMESHRRLLNESGRDDSP